MQDFINNLKNIVSKDVVLYIGIAFVLILIFTIFILMMKQKKAKKLLEELELKYNTLKSVPLAFKLNKAVALSRVNGDMAQRVEICKSDFDGVQEKLKE